MYGSRTDKELLEFLERHESLTFESQLNLKSELESRALKPDKNGLDITITNTLAKIKNLEFLKDFGFKADKNGKGLIVTRTTNAVLTDVAAVIIGVIVFFIGVYGIGSLISIFVNGEDINVFTLAINFAMASLVLTGFKFFNGIKRLFDYSGFELSNTQEGITLKKRFDLKLESIRKEASELFLEEYDEEMILRLGEHTVFNSNAENIIQRMTLEELTSALKEK